MPNLSRSRRTRIM
ncbi:hypothetical protein LEMLEM_LOCUS1892 [Lemmus lemmus]